MATCLDGTVLSWTFFRDSSVNIGAPTITDLVAIDWMGWRCPHCDVGILAAAQSRYTRAGSSRQRLFADGEFGDDEMVFLFPASCPTARGSP